MTTATLHDITNVTKLPKIAFSITYHHGRAYLMW